MTTFINSEWFILEQVLNRLFPEKMNAKSVFVQKIWPKWAPIAQKEPKKSQIPIYSTKYINMDIKSYLHSTRSKNIPLEILICSLSIHIGSKIDPGGALNGPKRGQKRVKSLYTPKYVNMDVKSYLHSTRSKNMPLEILIC